MSILLYIITIVCSIFVGIFIGKKSTKFDGMFIIDDNDDNITRWVLDVKVDPNTIPNKKEIRLKVRKLTKEDV